jgi:hypothetical protein
MKGSDAMVLFTATDASRSEKKSEKNKKVQWDVVWEVPWLLGEG